jgi:putative transposase
LILFVAVHAANIQERAGAKLVLTKAAEFDMPRLKTILSNDGYSGKPMADYVREEHGWRFVSVRRPELHKFQIMPKCWVVERTIGWMNNFRGLSKHYDRDSRTGEAKILLASIFYMTKRLTMSSSEPTWSIGNDDRLREKFKTPANST